MVSSEGAPIIVAQRLKRLPTIVSKLARFEEMELARMQDVGGCRAIVPSRKHVIGVTRRIRKNWDVKRLNDYTLEPKETGYRAVHVVVLREGRLIEIQLRTPPQQIWATEVERAGSRAGFLLKDGEGPPELVSAYEELAEEIAQLGDEPDPEALQRLFMPVRDRVRAYPGGGVQ